MSNQDDYSLAELQVAVTSREIEDNETVFAGVGIPCLGALQAKVMHAPNAIIAMEAGGIGVEPYRIVLGIGDNPVQEGALSCTSLWRLFSDQQIGCFDVGMLSGAQIDKYGNLNSTVIIGDQSYESPIVKLPGSGGANDIATSANRTIIMIPLERKRFVKDVDFITSPGYIDGKKREELNLPGGGPSIIVTDKCTFRFDEETKEAYLSKLFPGVEVAEVEEEVSWDLRIADDLEVVSDPTEREIEVTRTFDPEGIYTGDGLKDLSFDAYIEMLENNRLKIKELMEDIQE